MWRCFLLKILLQPPVQGYIIKVVAYLNCLDFSYFHFYRWRDFSSENPSPATSSRYIIGVIAHLNFLIWFFYIFVFYRWSDFSSENPSPATSSRYIIGVIAKVSEELLTQRGLKGGRGISLF